MSVTTMTVNFDENFNEPDGIQELNLSELDAINGGFGVFLAGILIGIAIGVYMQS